jgi:large subunit ribosomal protein L25
MSDSDLILKPKENTLNPRQLRKSGLIPVTIYGKNLENSLSYVIEQADYKRLALSKAIQTIKAKADSQEAHLLIIKSIERDAVSEAVLNIQFQKVSPDDLVKIVIPIVYTGSSPLVQAGGSLFINKKNVELLCPAKSIPANIQFDLGFFAGEKTIAHYSDLPISSDLQLKGQPSEIIAKVSVPALVVLADPKAK